MDNYKLYVFYIIFITFLFTVSCEKLAPLAPSEDQMLDGPMGGLTYQEIQQHNAGDVSFNDVIFTAETGLGPIFVSNSCGSCHAGDGKGHPFTTLTRFGQSDSTGNHYLDKGGRELQNRALPGYKPEQLPAGAPFAKFTPPAVTGLGFLQFVSDEDIIAMSDPDDANKDGISGVPNWIIPPKYVVIHTGAIKRNGKYIGRFGKKAAVYNLLHQTVDAAVQDMGITSSFDPIDVLSGLKTGAEISTQTVNDIVFYLQTLKAPIQRNQGDAQVIYGKTIFNKIRCATCHKPVLKTSQSSISALSYKKFYPYTDLLLHDMGPGLNDGYTEGNALSSEWRTPPLWGLGLAPQSQGGQYFLLHDGRAHSIEEAILMHGGEAKNSKMQFQNLLQNEKKILIKFLESL